MPEERPVEEKSGGKVSVTSRGRSSGIASGGWDGGGITQSLGAAMERGAADAVRGGRSAMS